MLLLRFSKKYLTYQKKHVKLSLINYFTNLIFCLCDCSFPVLVALLLKKLTNHNQFYWVLILLFLNLTILILISVFQKKYSVTLAQKVIHDIRFSILDQVQKWNLEKQGKINDSQIMLLFTKTLFELENCLVLFISKFNGLALSVLISTIILFIYDWKLALFVITILIFLNQIPIYFKKKSQFYLQEKNSLEALAISHLEEETRLKKIIQLFLLTDFRKKIFEIKLKQIETVSIKYGFYLDNVYNANYMSTHFVRVVMLIVGAILVANNKMTIMQLTGFYLALGNVALSISSYASTSSTVIQAEASLDFINKFLKQSPEIVMNELKNNEKINRNYNLPNFQKSILFKEIEFNLQDQIILNKINLEIKKGQFIAIVGQSGSGKSSLIKLLLKEVPSSKGTIEIDGIELSNVSIQSLYRQIGVVYDNPFLFQGTIFDNIKYGNLSASDEDVYEAARLAEFHEECKKLTFGYNTIIEKNPKSLSAGQCQRIAIARALIANSPILILDEATSSLDPINCELIDNTILKMSKNKTIISVTHRLKSVQNAHHIVVLKNGEIFEQGPHKFLMEKKGLYFEMWSKQNGVEITSATEGHFVKDEWLQFIPLFKAFSNDLLKQLSVEFELERCDANKVLFNEGDFGDKFYIIAAGIVTIFHKNKVTNESEFVTKLFDGDFFGEVALLKNTPRTATIETNSVCFFMVLSRHRFEKVISILPDDLKYELIQKAHERLASYSDFNN